MSILQNLLCDTRMASSLPLSENSPLHEILNVLKLRLCETNFIWTVKEEVTQIFGNLL